MFKVTVSSEQVRAMNSDVKIEALTQAVGEDTESTFNDEFFENVDCIANALDNVKARECR